MGAAVGLGPAIELEGLVDRVPADGGGHVHELLDVPALRLGPVDGGVEAPLHGAGVPEVLQLPPAREVRVPVRPGRIPEVHVGIDDAVGLPHPIPLSTVSNQSGISVPPSVMLPAGRGWLRSPIQPAPATSSAPDSAGASGLHTRWAASSPTSVASPASELTANAAT